MPLVTVSDVLAELGPAYEITATTAPSDTDVEQFIAQIEAEVSALWSGAGGAWPVAGAAAAVYPTLTILLGVKWRYLDAVFSASSTAMTPDAVAQARLAYNDRLNRIARVVSGSEAVTDTLIAGDVPQVAVAAHGPMWGSSFGEWTQRRDWRTSGRWGEWPW